MAAVEQLVNEKITDAFKSEAISKLKGLADLYAVYLSELELWLEHPHDPSIIQSVWTRFLDLDSEFISSILQFTINGFEAQLSPVYEQTANLHLLLLLGVTIHAHQLNILKYPQNEKIALLKVNIKLEYRLTRNNN